MYNCILDEQNSNKKLLKQEVLILVFSYIRYLIATCGHVVANCVLVSFFFDESRLLEIIIRKRYVCWSWHFEHEDINGFLLVICLGLVTAKMLKEN